MCSASFTKKAGNQIYCSVKCRRKGNLMKVKNNCPQCGKEYYTANNESDARKFCSRECMKNSYFIDVPKSELDRLYTVERLSAEKISNIYNVSKPTILRALKRYGINRRTGLETMMPEGYKAPSKKELLDLYWKDWKSYEEIAELFNVDITTVPYWFKEHGIESRSNSETRLGKDFKEPTKEMLTEWYVKQKLDTVTIGEMLGCGAGLVARRLKSFDIEVRSNIFNGADFITCSNGLEVRSNYERMFVEQMVKQNIEFEYEPRLPFNRRYSADFLVKDMYVEVWGVQNNKRYSERKIKKKRLYKNNNAKLFNVYPNDFANIKDKVNELKHLIS